MTAPRPQPTTLDHDPADVSVLYLIDHLASGGAEQVLVRYLRHLDGNGVRASVAAIQERDGNPLTSDIRDLGIAVTTLGIGHLRERGAARLVREHIAMVDPDVVHTQLEFSNVLGTLGAARLGIPSVATLHTLDAPPRWSRDALRYRLMTQVLKRRARRVIAVSESARQHHLDIGGLRPDRTITIHNGIDLEPYRNPPDGSRRRVRSTLAIPADASVITTVAVQREPKGLQHMIRAMPAVLTAHPTAIYVLVGDGPHAASLAAEVDALGVTESVRFAGATDDVPAFLAATDVFVLPSLTEALPTVIAEAMAASLPIVATTVGGIPEMVRHGDTATLVEPGDDQALARSVIHLLDNPIQATAMGKSAYRSARERFSIEARAAELLGEYRHLSGRQP